MNTKLNILKAHHGDSIIIETYDSKDNKFTLLIDGGPSETFKTALVQELEKYQKIDLIVLTHADHDHISGLIHYLSSPYASRHEIGALLVNAPNLQKVSAGGTQISIDEGIEFEKLIHKHFPNLKIISEVTSHSQLDLELPEGIEIKILSPNRSALDKLYENWPEEELLKEDEETQIGAEDTPAKDFDVTFEGLAQNADQEKSIETDFVNASSIAFSIKSKDFHGLFLGDAHASIVLEGLCEQYPDSNPVAVDYVKVSHHGSRFNISNAFLNKIKCYNYIISTNGGKGRSKHPDRETVAKIVKHNNMKEYKVQLHFNYPLAEIEMKTGRLFTEDELKFFDCHNTNEIKV